MLIFTYKADILIQHNICHKIYDIKNNFFNKASFIISLVAIKSLFSFLPFIIISIVM